MTTPFKITRLCALLGASLVVAAAQAAPLTKDEYKAEKSRIEADYDAARDGCKSLSGNAKDVCVEQAKGDEKVRKAELEVRQVPTAANQEKLAEARADAAYEVAEEKCDDLAGNPKDVCVKEAKAARTQAMADAKAARVSSNARTDAADDTRDARYKVEAAKCDSLAGDAKDACIAAAKARLGK